MCRQDFTFTKMAPRDTPSIRGRGSKNNGSSARKRAGTVRQQAAGSDNENDSSKFSMFKNREIVSNCFTAVSHTTTLATMNITPSNRSQCSQQQQATVSGEGSPAPRPRSVSLHFYPLVLQNSE